MQPQAQPRRGPNDKNLQCYAGQQSASPFSCIAESAARAAKVERSCSQEGRLRKTIVAREAGRLSAVFARNSECWHVAERYGRQSRPLGLRSVTTR